MPSRMLSTISIRREVLSVVHSQAMSDNYSHPDAHHIPVMKPMHPVDAGQANPVWESIPVELLGRIFGSFNDRKSSPFCPIIIYESS